MDVSSAGSTDSFADLKYRNAGNATLLDLVTQTPGRALDIGCGAGDNAAILSGRGWTVEGVTIDEDEAAAAGPSCARVHLGDLEEGVPSSVEGVFDLVIFSHVLEHIRQPEELLRRVSQVLGPSGVIAVALPNVLHYRQRLKFFKGEFAYTETGILDRTHLRFYTFVSARQMIESAGYQVLHAEPDGPLPVGRLTAHLPQPLRSRLASRALAAFPGLLAYQSLFVARRAQASSQDS